MRRTTKLSHPRRLGLLPLRGAWLRLSMTLLVMMLSATTAWAQGENYVASVTAGNTTTYDYYDVNNAVSAAIAAYVPASGETPAVVPTITLLKDVNVGISLEFSTNNNEAAVILDLNGKTISGFFGNYITLTITDSKGGGVINAGNYEHAIFNSGNLTIEGGEIRGGDEGTIKNVGTLILNGGSIVTTYCGIKNVEYGLLTINGGTISAEGDPNYPESPGKAILNYATLTVCGGRIENSDIGIESNSFFGDPTFIMTGLPTFSGNDVDIFLDEGIKIEFTENISSAPTTLIKLDLDDTSIPFTSGYASHCVGFPPSRMFEYVGNRDNVFVGHNSEGEGKTREGYRLMDDSDNSSAIDYWKEDGYRCYVQLYGRTFYRNGDWNTLCLPFSLTADQIAHSNLEGAIIKELNTSESNLDSNGQLTLTFVTATAGDDDNIIKAGKPYIVKWDAEENKANIIDPIFTDVKISVTKPVPVTFDNAKGCDCEFVGQFSPFAITESTKNEILMLGSGNKLGYSKSARDLMCFRAHFLIPTTSGQAGARDFRINFGDEETTAIVSMEDGRRNTEDVNGIWYTLDGRRFDGKPTKKGVYIVNGKKIVIK